MTEMRFSYKHKTFIASPMDKLSVNDVPGIGSAYAKMLAQQGYMQASQLYVQYIQCLQEKQQYVNWLQQVTGGNTYNLNQTYNAMAEWNAQISSP